MLFWVIAMPSVSKAGASEHAGPLAERGLSARIIALWATALARE